MTLLYIDGFDHQSARDWVQSGMAFSAGGRFGYGYAYRGISGSYYIKRSFKPSAEIYVGFAGVFPAQTGSNYQLALQGDNGATTHLFMRRQGNALAVFRGATQVAVSAEGTYSGAWSYIEVYLKVHDTAGRIIVRVEEVVVIDFTGDTRNGGTSTDIDAIVLWGSTSSDTLIDDLYICDALGTENNTFLGEQRVVILTPNGPGSTTQLTPTGVANNWGNVDELPPASTDYNASSVIGDRDLYALSDLPAGVQTIRGIQTTLIATKSDTGIAAMKTVLKSGANTTVGTAFSILTSATYNTLVFEKNPNANVSWATTAVNALEVGAEVA